MGRNMMGSQREISSEEGKAANLSTGAPGQLRDPQSESSILDCSCANWPSDQPNSRLINNLIMLQTNSASLSSTAPLRRVRARQIICHPKDGLEHVTVICSGWASSSVLLPDSRRQILSFLLPGEFVSIASIFGITSSRLVEAITEVSYRRFRRVDVEVALRNNPDLLADIHQAWIEECKVADRLIVDMGRRTASERVARQILYLADKLSGRNMMNGLVMEFPLRQRQIADATGLTQVHVSKMMISLQRSGVIV
ncbi:MAG TPA: Crp/Fnr family transcriptional regulator, partial [Lacipirellulaceae bacterium]|nr:Crp/Fnr family transcriptional regulator [Lacipirellulaceae bacterium]